MKLHIGSPALAARPNAAISIQIHQSTSSRSGFDDVIANRELGGTLYLLNQIRLSSVQPDANSNVSITFGLSSAGIHRAGVYPVEVQLVNTDQATTSFVTWLVVVDTASSKAIDKKLSVAMVMQVVAPPITLPDGSDDPKVVAELKPGGRLDKIANVLGGTTGLRFSMVLGPETAESWTRLGKRDRRMASSFSYVRAAAQRSTTEILPTSYVPIDAAAVEAAGLGAYLPGQYAKGASTLQTTVGVDPAVSAQSAFVDSAPTSDAAVNGLRSALIDRVAVREQALIPVTHPFSPAEAFVLATTGGQVRAASTAPFVEGLFTGPDSPALRAVRVVAALAEVAYETPSIARGIVIAVPADWNPDLTTTRTVVDALRTLPLVQSATLDDLFGSISNEQAQGSGVQRRLVPAVPSPAPANATDYDTTAHQLSAYRAVVGPRDPVVVRGQLALRTALSTDISVDRAKALLAQTAIAVQSFSAGITADEKRITLTSRTAKVPLTFENNLRPARVVTVRVHLDSAKLIFPNGADQTVPLKPGSNTIRFTVEARASGTFPMTISVTSPDGRLAFGPPVRVTVRSAVFGGWAVWLTGAALVFLAGWWANHFRRTRRNRRIASRASRAPAPAPST